MAARERLPEGVKVVEVNYDDENSLVAALSGQQFLVITLAVTAAPETHSNIAKAAVKAGVPYIMPNVYGGDVFHPSFANEQYTKEAVKRTLEIKELGGTYIYMACGFWYEWSLALGENFFGFDIKNKKAIFFDDGNARINVSTWEQCGRALAALLSLPESGASPSVSDFKNGPLRPESFQVSQRDMLNSLHRVLGTSDKDWTITAEPSAERYADGLARMQQGDRQGFAKALYSRYFFPGGG